MEIPYTYQKAHLASTDLPEKYAKIVFDWYMGGKNTLFYSGNAGIGKTYLCYALYQKILEDKMNVRFYKERDFFNALRSIIQAGHDYEYEVNRLCDVHWFIIDDLGASQTTDWQKEVLFSMLDNRYSSQKPTLITSNLGDREILNTYGKRFWSRLYSNRNVILCPTDLNDRRVEET